MAASFTPSTPSTVFSSLSSLPSLTPLRPLTASTTIGEMMSSNITRAVSPMASSTATPPPSTLDDLHPALFHDQLDDPLRLPQHRQLAPPQHRELTHPQHRELVQPQYQPHQQHIPQQHLQQQPQQPHHQRDLQATTLVTCTPTALQSKLSILILTDQFPDDTSWELYDTSPPTSPTSQYGNLITSYDILSTGSTDPLNPLAPFSYVGESTQIIEVCLDYCTGYQFVMYDSYGDGLTAASPSGYYELIVTHNDLVPGVGGTVAVNSTIRGGTGFFTEESTIVDVDPLKLCPSAAPSTSSSPSASSAPSAMASASPSSSPSVDPCPDPLDAKITITVQTDLYSSTDSSWKLVTGGGVIVEERPIGSFVDSTTSTENICVSKCLSVTFSFYDAYGDGFGVGGGYFKLEFDDGGDGGTNPNSSPIIGGLPDENGDYEFAVLTYENLNLDPYGECPSEVPSVSPSAGPSVSSMPSQSLVPSVSSGPSFVPSISGRPTDSMVPSHSSVPSGSPSISWVPSSSNVPTMSDVPTLTVGPSVVPSASLAPSSSGVPSSSNGPSVSHRPSFDGSDSPSLVPSVSYGPTSSILPTVTVPPSSSISPSSSPSTSLNPTLSDSPSTSNVPSSSGMPTTTPFCNVGESKLTIAVLTDLFPTDQNWEIYEGDSTGGNLVQDLAGTGITYPPETLTTLHLCLDYCKVYSFIFYDEYGDGMTASVPSGYFELTVNDDPSTTLTGGMGFYSEQRVLLNVDPEGNCGTNAPSSSTSPSMSANPTGIASQAPSIPPSIDPCPDPLDAKLQLTVQSDLYSPGDNSWSITDAQGTIVESRPIGFFPASTTTFEVLCISKCIDATFTFYDDYGDGFGVGGGFFQLVFEEGVNDPNDPNNPNNPIVGGLPDGNGDESFSSLVYELNLDPSGECPSGMPSGSPSVSLVPSGSWSPSTSDVPSSSRVPSLGPSFSLAPTTSLVPTLTMSPSASLFPSSGPSASILPTSSDRPSLTGVPSSSHQPSTALSSIPSTLPTSSSSPSLSNAPTSTSSPSSSPSSFCNTGESKLTIAVQTDNYPNDQNWELYDGDNTFIQDLDGTGVTYAASSLNVLHLCLDYCKTYKFVMYDAFGDGMTQGFTPGYYQLIVNDDPATVITGGTGMFTELTEESLNLDPEGRCATSSPSTSSSPSMSASPTGISSHAPSSSPSVDPCPDPLDAKIKITVDTDLYSSGDNSWRITNAVGDTVEERAVGFFPDSDITLEVICVSKCIDATFTFYDEYGDGFGAGGGKFQLEFDDGVNSPIIGGLPDADGNYEFSALVYRLNLDPHGDCPSEQPSSSPSSSAVPSSSSVPSASVVPSLTVSPSEAPSLTVLPTLTVAPSSSSSPTSSHHPSRLFSESPSFAPSSSNVPSLSTAPSFSNGPSQSNEPSAQPSLSYVPTVTTSVPSSSSSPSSSVSPSDTPSLSIAPSFSVVPTSSSKPSSSFEPSAQPSWSSVPSITSMPSSSAGPSNSLVPSAQPSSSNVPSMSADPTVTYAPTTSIEPSAQPSSTSVPSASSAPTSSSVPSASVSPSAVPSSSHIPSFTAAPSASIGPSNTLQPSREPSSSPSAGVSHEPSSHPSMVPSSFPSSSSVPSSSLLPTFLDSDGDGLSDDRENELGTDPNNRDTDGDNLDDGEEANDIGTDPLNPDTDGDGYEDGKEVANGTDPLDPNDPGTGEDVNPDGDSDPESEGLVYYPDWGSQTCLNDSKQPDYMRTSPKVWMHRTRESCCQTNFGWQVEACIKGPTNVNGDALYYPEWSGNGGDEESICRNDNKAPDFMTSYPEYWMTETLEVCCQKFFAWDVDQCILQGSGGSTDTDDNVNSGYIYYPDWERTDTCRSDSLEPDYMKRSPKVWMHATIEECCYANYRSKVEECINGEIYTSGSGLYYPDWEENGNNAAECKLDDGVQKPPNFMSSWPDIWMHETIEGCCEQNFPSEYDQCVNNAGGSTTQSGWYSDYSTNECKKSCNVSDTDPECGGIAKAEDYIYDTKDTCCFERLWWVETCTSSLE